jgi:hypothetical protein
MKTASNPSIERVDARLEESAHGRDVEGLDASCGIITGMLAGSVLWLALILAFLTFR